MSSNNFFPRVTPESLGIPSGAIASFIEELALEKLNIHGFVIMRHGKVAAEVYYKPFSADTPHRMYSTTKSFVSVAIGLLCDEGKISLADKAVSFFPDKLPERVHPYIEAMTIRDLLMMSSAHKNTTYGRRNDPNEDWVGTFFTEVPTHYPGHVFSYDTSATTTLTAIVERVSGKPFIEYMKDKMLRHMGFSEDAFCVKTGDGQFSWGGSGLCCNLRDLTRFAYMILNKGKWADGKQLISEKYITEATSRQIDNSVARRAEGYGYQFWRWPENGFGCSGMGTQNVFCYPDEDLIFTVIADTQPHPYGAALVQKLFLSNVKHSLGSPLPENADAQRQLASLMNSLAVPAMEGDAYSPMAEKVSGNKYALESTGALGGMNFDSAGFSFGEGEGAITLEREGKERTIKFGLGGFVHQDFPEYSTKEEMEGEDICAYGFGPKCKLNLPCMNSGSWVDENRLVIVCYAIGTFVGTLKIEAVFDEDRVTIVCLKFAEKFWENYDGFQSGKLI
ncbi:MAG: serine hydrolase domain-containing protein [Christensenellales bacterium]|jgi:CubicO group peptidase (beta-lactamase class C family)